MIRGVILLVVAFGVLVGAGITILGLFAPIAPTLEIANHFRPFVLFGFLVLFAIALVFRMRRWLVPVSAFALLNAALFTLPLTFQASEAATDPASGAMKIVSFNIWVGNRTLGDIERFLRDQDADVVLLQEISSDNATELLPKLKDLYPHQLSCATSRACHLALLSRQPWTEANHIDSSLENPALIWAASAPGRTRTGSPVCTTPGRFTRTRRPTTRNG